jgi:hypothetical protein
MIKTKELFEKWNNQKILIENNGKIKRIKNGEIWVTKI